jgi:hypothetical protein
MFGKSLPSSTLPASPSSRTSGSAAPGNGASLSQNPVKIIVVSSTTRSWSAASRRNSR